MLQNTKIEEFYQIFSFCSTIISDNKEPKIKVYKEFLPSNEIIYPNFKSTKVYPHFHLFEEAFKSSQSTAETMEESFDRFNVNIEDNKCFRIVHENGSQIFHESILKFRVTKYAHTTNFIVRSFLYRKEVFEDEDFAWKVLDQEIKLETSGSIGGEDVANLLQLYMVEISSIESGVERMNSFMDYREAFFKERVLSLMSRPSVIKALNRGNFMGKKTMPGEARASTERETLTRNVSSSINEKVKHEKSKIENTNEFLQLKEKKKEIEVRLAYGAEERSAEYVNRILEAQAKKECLIRNKVSSISNQHEEKLLSRITARRLKTMAAKSEVSETNSINYQRNDSLTLTNNKIETNEITQRIFNCLEVDLNRRALIKESRVNNPHKSLSPKTERKNKIGAHSSLRKAMSYNRQINEYEERENIRNA